MARRLAARDSDEGDEVTGWAIVGGADRSEFSIAPDTGELSFREAPDYESPADAASTDPVSGAGDNQYLVTVEVTSGAGTRELEAEQTFTIRVTDEREPPEVPEAPTFSGETADSLTVSWSEPENTGPPITDYDVQYREEGRGGFTGAPHQGPGRSLTLSDLEAGTLYQVQVRATNEEGTSGWSASGEGMTVTPLTVVMASGADPPVSGPFTVRFSFSEPVTGFSRSDIETQPGPCLQWIAIRTTRSSCDPRIGGLADHRRPGLHRHGNAADRPGGPQLHLEADGCGRRREIVGGQQAERRARGAAGGPGIAAGVARADFIHRPPGEFRQRVGEAELEPALG